MTRVIVHAGFHKTGTTSLQAFLEQNRAALKPWGDVYLKTDLGRARYQGRWYGQRPGRLRLRLFHTSFRQFLRGIPDADTIVISRESFSGMMPGHLRHKTRVTGYRDQAIPLAQEIVGAARDRFGKSCDIQLLYTVRDQDAWVHSLYRHLLRTTPLRDDYDSFHHDFALAPNLAQEVSAIAAALAPVPVQMVSLEKAQSHRLGLGAVVLEAMNVPPSKWQPFRRPDHHNRGPSVDLAQKFLEMNRRERSGPALKAAKARLAEAERKHGA